MSLLRNRTHEIIDNISEGKIPAVLDFLEYLKAKEEVKATNKIFNDKKVLDAVHKRLIEAKSRNLIYSEELIDNDENIFTSEDSRNIWRKVLDIVKKELSEVSFETWLKIIKPLSIDKNALHLGVLSEFEKSIIECRYFELLKTALRSITNKDFKIELSVIGYEKKEVVLNKEITAEVDKKRSSLNPKYSFDTYVVGEHNKLAYRHVFDAAENPYNNGKLLYIHGEVATGKTHLIQAAGNYISEHHTDAKVRYISIDDFIYEMIEAIRDDNSKEFKQKLSGYDLLLIDNLQFIAGKEATQEEFFKIVSVLLERGKNIIIASTEPPQNITIMNERFTSMFELGGVFEIKGPDLDTRLEILRRRRAEGNFELLDEEISNIAYNTSDNVRELLNAFNRFVAYDKMTEAHENLS